MLFPIRILKLYKSDSKWPRPFNRSYKRIIGDSVFSANVSFSVCDASSAEVVVPEGGRHHRRKRGSLISDSDCFSILHCSSDGVGRISRRYMETMMTNLRMGEQVLPSCVQVCIIHSYMQAEWELISDLSLVWILFSPYSFQSVLMMNKNKSGSVFIIFIPLHDWYVGRMIICITRGYANFA